MWIDIFIKFYLLGMCYFDKMFVGSIVLCVINDIEVVKDMFINVFLIVI